MNTREATQAALSELTPCEAKLLPSTVAITTAIPNSEVLERITEFETLIVEQQIPWENLVILTEWLDGFRDRIEQDESETRT